MWMRNKKSARWGALSLAFCFSAPIWAGEAECRANPTIDCLADTAYALSRGHTHENWQIGGLVKSLSRVGHFEQALDIASSASDTLTKQTAQMDIVANEIAWSARSSGGTATSLDPLDRLETDKPPFHANIIPLVLNTTILDLIGKHPYDGGISLGTEATDGPHIPTAITRASVDALMTRWREVIPTLDEKARSTNWTDYAVVMIDMGDVNAAKAALAAAQPGSPVPSLIARQWLRLDDPNHALKVMDETDGHWAETFLDIAKSMKQHQRPTFEIRNTLIRAFSDASTQMSGTPAFGSERAIVKMMNAAVGKDEAMKLVEQAHTQAQAMKLLPWIGLTSVGGMYVDIGENERARQTLAEALAALPTNEHSMVAIGAVAGPMTMSNWHIGDSAHTELAIQFYRLNDMQSFARMIDLIKDPDYRAEPWQQLFSETIPDGVPLPQIHDAQTSSPPHVRGVMLTHIAAEMFKKGDRRDALALIKALEQQIIDQKTGLNTVNWGDVGRIALALNDRDTLAVAVKRMIAAAWGSGDGEAQALALTAAHWKSWLDGAALN